MINVFRFRRCEELLCPYCGKKFTLKYSYLSHIQDHEGKGRKKSAVQCATCGKEFGDKVALTSHMAAAHGAEKHLKCDICGKKFAVEARLRVSVFVN